jgi:hypothetical protein
MVSVHDGVDGVKGVDDFGGLLADDGGPEERRGTGRHLQFERKGGWSWFCGFNVNLHNLF